MHEYFDWVFEIKKNKPSLKIMLKPEYKKVEKALRISGRSYSGVQKEFYLHHIENKSLAINIWEYRKSLCAISKAFSEGYKYKYISEQEFGIAQDYLERVRVKFENNHKIAMESEKVRKNIIASQTPEKLRKSGEGVRAAWKKNRKKYMEALHNPKVQKSRVANFKKHLEDPKNHAKYLKAMRNPERLKKISAAAKLMWQNSDDDKIKKMQNRYRKNKTYNGFKMNKPEEIIAKYLDKMGYTWEYERVLRLDKEFFQPDFIINDSLIIEVYGDFWHANPNTYEDDHVLYSKITAKEQRDRDSCREKKIQEFFPVIVIWETDIKNNSYKQKIMEALCQS